MEALKIVMLAVFGLFLIFFFYYALPENLIAEYRFYALGGVLLIAIMFVFILASIFKSL